MLPYCFASAAPFLQNSCFWFVNSHPKMLQTHHSQQPLSNHDIHNRTQQTCCIMHPQAFHLFERLIKHIVSAQKKQRTSNHQKHHDPPLMQQHCHLSTTASPWLLNSSSSLLHKHTVTWANHNSQTWWPLFFCLGFMPHEHVWMCWPTALRKCCSLSHMMRRSAFTQAKATKQLGAGRIADITEVKAGSSKPQQLPVAFTNAVAHLQQV